MLYDVFPEPPDDGFKTPDKVTFPYVPNDGDNPDNVVSNEVTAIELKNSFVYVVPDAQYKICPGLGSELFPVPPESGDIAPDVLSARGITEYTQSPD